jgi:hypothetical protein
MIDNAPLKRVILACMHTLYVIEKGRNYISLSRDIFGLSTPGNKLKIKVVYLHVTLEFAFHVHDYIVYDIHLYIDEFLISSLHIDHMPIVHAF